MGGAVAGGGGVTQWFSTQPFRRSTTPTSVCLNGRGPTCALNVFTGRIRRFEQVQTAGGEFAAELDWNLCVFCFDLNSAPDDRLDATYITNTHASKVTSRLVLSFKSGKTKSHLHVTRERRPTGCRKKGNTFLLTQILFFTDSHRQSTISSVSVWSPPVFYCAAVLFSHLLTFSAGVTTVLSRGGGASLSLELLFLHLRWKQSKIQLTTWCKIMF